MTLSIDESLQKLKAEILAQDWRLPPRRIEPLEQAFVCLKQRFKSRKHVLAILTMAESVLLYVKRQDGDPPPRCIDFLKEAMAHVVAIHEEGKFDPQQEEALFKRVYSQFDLLKKVVQAGKRGMADEEEPFAVPAAAPSPPPDAPPPTPASPAERPARAPQIYAPPPGTAFRALTIGELTVGIDEESLAYITTITARKRAAYIKTSHIPLKDFTPLFGSLARQFHGPLATIKSGTLKKLELPLMTPQGLGLPPIPDDTAHYLLVISCGQWHGVVLANHVAEELRLLRSFTKGKNGDIAGAGTMDDESLLPLLNPLTLVQREGFLAAVDRNFLAS
ncbi:MAG: hypothetical protein AB1413_06110 [Thermodesulfobacteriota bacterium]